MLKQERLTYIMHQVNLHNKVLCTDLSHDIQVSDDTIRRDLQELADEGKLVKVHGGALSISFSKGINVSQVYSHFNKTIIAKKAASLVSDGMFVLTSGGTTIQELARTLPEQLRATFISGSLPALLEYSSHPNIDVVVVGDRISKSSKITIGPDAISKIRQFKSDLCFLGINAIDTEFGVSDNDWDVVQVKKAMIDSAKKVVCLSISEKINSMQPIQVCGLNRIDMLITELSPDHPLLAPYREAGITVL